jgi:serine/threonine protein kinase
VKASSKSLTSGSFQQSGSGSVDLLSETSMSQEARKPKKKGNGKTVDPKEDDEDKDKTVKFSKDSIDIETGKKASTQLKSGSSSTDWSKLLNMHHNDNVLKILESATASNHGSSSWEVSLSSHQGIISRNIPLWMKFDEHSRLKKDFINEMRLLSRLRHPCITTVMGAVISVQADPMLIMEFMEYGSLYDLLHNETMSAGGEILLQIMRDIVQGIQFLHASKPPILHGDLKVRKKRA